MIKFFINSIVIQPLIGKVNIKLRKGLNIIRADKVQTEIDSGPRNSLGKSTFVKLIDYGLGRTNFLNKNDRIAKRELIDHYLIMEVALNDNHYTIQRTLVDNSECFIYEGWVSKNILRGENINKIVGPELDDYKAFLENKLLMRSNYSREEKLLSLRQFIPLVVRDQVKGFSDIFKPFGISEGAQLSRLRAEFFSGLSTVKKMELEKNLNEVEENRKNALQDFNIISKYIQKKLEQEKIDDINNTIETLDKEILELQSDIVRLRGELSNKTENERSIQATINQMENEIINMDKRLNSNKSRIFNYEATVNEIYKELETFNLYNYASKLLDNFDQDVCPVCLSQIKSKQNEDQCSHRDNEVTLLKRENTVKIIKEILNNEINDLESAISDLNRQCESLVETKNLLQQKIIKEKNSLDIVNKQVIDKLNKKEQDLLELNKRKVENINIKKALSDVEKYKQAWMKYKNRKRDIAKALETASLEVEKNRERLINTYDKVVRYLYNNSRQGILKFSPKAGNIEVEIAYINEEQSIDKGAAAQIVKVIAYDLTLLELSLMNKTYHPKFLIHDSPNINDIDMDVYHRIFSYIIDLEKKQLKENNSVDFQYIITTITIPEEEIEKEHIILELDGNGEGGKLLGFTF
ncbi:DUF2326 domain-containing protein [Shouchella clausii]|uniref:DUF2326 domain-containing protein n=1 Tax=Shouchella clausii TaxID=79880 RepID=UPI000BA66528|nr:DUF2326 domain-containing protein [Shouchella clausii]PAD93585.1 hypothetical protein CHH52_03900 [Shouchella clausii]